MRCPGEVSGLDRMARPRRCAHAFTFPPVSSGMMRGLRLGIFGAHAAKRDGSTEQDLAETTAAIARIEIGTYGRCERCGGAIGRQRLLALPAARYCISCAPAARGS